MNKPISLIDFQFEQIKAAAASLRPSERDDFLQGLARRLGESPSDEAVPTFVGGK